MPNSVGMVVDKTNKKSVISYYVPKHKQYLQGLDQKPWVRSLFFHCISLCCRNNKEHSSCLCNAKYRFRKIEGKSCSSKCTNKEKSILFLIGQTPRPKCDKASIQTHWPQLWGNLANNKNTSNQDSHFTQEELLNFFFFLYQNSLCLISVDVLLWFQVSNKTFPNRSESEHEESSGRPS